MKLEIKRELLEITNEINLKVKDIKDTTLQLLGAVNQILSSVGNLIGQSSNQFESLTNLLNELSTKLGYFQEQANQIKNVGQSISRLEDLFKVPQFRGKFGEILLEKIIEETLPKELYEFQYKLSNGQVVDAIIKFQDRILPIDSKFPLNNYLKIMESDNQDQKEKLKKEFLKDVRNRINEIASKYILPNQGTFNFAIMYIPSETIYYEVVSDEETISYMIEKKVVPASPTVFYAKLMIFLIGFKALEVEKNAKNIIDYLSRLEKEISQLIELYKTLGNHIKNVSSKYNETLQKLESIKDLIRIITKNFTNL
jgi:DNA recombination protein RmuC